MGDDMVSGLSGVGSVMTAGLTVPILAFAAGAIKSGEDYEQMTNTIIDKTGASGAQLTMLKGVASNVWGSYAISAQQAGTVTSEVYDRLKALNGGIPPTAAQVRDLTGAFIEYSKVTGTDVTTDTDQLTGAMKQLNVPVGQQKAALNDLTEVYQHTGVSATQLTSDMTANSRYAQAAGLTWDQYAAMVGTADAAHVKLRPAMTAVNAVIAQGSKEGLSATASWAEMNKEMATYDATGQKGALISKMSATQLTSLNSLYKSGATNLNQLTKEYYTNNDALDQSYQKTLTFGDRLTILKNQIEVALAPLGLTLIDIATKAMTGLEPLIGVLGKVLSIFSGLPEPIQMVGIALAAIVAAIGPILMILPQLVEGFGMLQTAFAFISGGGIADAFGGIAEAITGTVVPAAGEAAAAFMAMDLPLLPIIIAVAAIGIALYLLYTYFKPFHDAVNEVVGWVKELVGDLASGNFGKFGADFAAGIKTAISDLLNFDWGGLGNKIKIGIETALATFGTWLWGLIQPLPMKLWSTYIGIWAQIGTWLWSLIQPLPQKLWSALQSAIGTFGAWLWSLISPIPGELGSGIQSAISGFGAWLMSAASGFFGGLPGKIQGAISGLGDWLISAASGFATWLSNAVQNAIKQLPGGSQALSAGGTVASAAGGAVNAVTSLQTGGTITSSGLFNLHAGEAVIPPENTTDMGGNYTFTVNFNNATIQSQAQAETFSRIMAYQATSLMRRQGLSKG